MAHLIEAKTENYTTSWDVTVGPLTNVGQRPSSWRASGGRRPWQVLHGVIAVVILVLAAQLLVMR